MNDDRGTMGLGVLGFWNGPLRFQPPHSNSVREDETAVCLDCHVTFSIRNRACPKCDGDHFWLISNWKRPASRPAFSPGRAAIA